MAGSGGDAVSTGSGPPGRSVLETRGLGWAITFHGRLDFVFFAAHFVPAR